MLPPCRPRARLAALLLVAVLASATLGGCAVGASPAPSGAGSGLHPHLGPEHRGHHRATSPHQRGRHQPGPTSSRRHHGATSGGRASQHHAPAPAASTSAAPSPATSHASASPGTAPATVRVDDATGDVDGVAPPSFADLTRTALTRTAAGYQLEVEAGGALPASSSDHTMHVIGFVDTDGDGQIDYELWATLADNGWNPAWRTPDGAFFGSAAGIRISVEGTRLTMSFAADRVGGAHSFRWLVGAEYGTDAQLASGTQTSDYAPDRGGASSP